MKVELTKEKETLLITLCARAMESRAADSVLRDHWAAEAVERIDYDFAKLRLKPDEAIGVAMRARRFDLWTSEFLAENPGGIVVNLGCGLDSRAWRVDPPPTVPWFDVDFPEVVELRRRLLPDRPGARPIGSSVTDPGWMGELPADRPALVLAEGLTPYLAEDEVGRLFVRLTETLESGLLAFDAYSRQGLRIMENLPCIRATGASFRWGLDDPREVEAMAPRLTLVAESPYHDPATVGRMSWPSRLLFRAWAWLPAFQPIGRLLRYRF